MLVLHINWFEGSGDTLGAGAGAGEGEGGALALWAESREAAVAALALQPVAVAAPADDSPHRSDGMRAPDSGVAGRHVFAASAAEISQALRLGGAVEDDDLNGMVDLRLLLPSDERGPRPSDRLAAALGILPDDSHVGWLAEHAVPAVLIRNHRALGALLRMEDHGPDAELVFSPSVRFWQDVARFALDLLVDQRFVPTLVQQQGNRLLGLWQPWLADEGIRSRAAALLAAMPPAVRACGEDSSQRPWDILESALTTLTDAAVRRILVEEGFDDSIANRDALDPHVIWLRGLLAPRCEVVPPPAIWADLVRDVRHWIARLGDVGQDRPLVLGLRLTEPPASLLEQDQADAAAAPWQLGFRLVSSEDHQLVAEAEDVWSNPAAVHAVDGRRVADAQGLLLSELGRAARLYPRIETALDNAAPAALELTTAQAYEFLRDYEPLLQESGFDVSVPDWWGQPLSRLGARLRIDADEAPSNSVSGDPVLRVGALGLNSIVRYRWQIAVGDQPLSLEQFQRMVEQAARGGPLVRVGGRWIEVRNEDLERAAAFLRERPGGEITVLEAIRLAYGYDGQAGGLPVIGLDATGWVQRLLEASSASTHMERLPQPESFIGSLRPYQKSGISWLAFLDRFGLGACLADDMGLGKTIQLIALLLSERERASAATTSIAVGDATADVPSVGPTLLIVPTSVVSNWTRELHRFAPSLKVHVHHGLERPTGRRFAEAVAASDVVITTYALVPRDSLALTSIPWHRVVLDEAQYIKNPPTKQATAIRALQAPRRVALTGTPVENRLSELWSIMDFCNPGYLGQQAHFRRHMAVPIERHRDRAAAERLRALVRPFILRRLKSDPTVISDLPQLVETREYATLTAEQARLYQTIVDSMLAQVDQAEGIQRRGLVLAALVKLKQLCNHPSLLLKDVDLLRRGPANGNGDGLLAAGDAADNVSDDVDITAGASGAALTTAAAAPTDLLQRSGKCRRLLEMLEELLAAGDRAIVFTQFRQMGHLLAAMIRQTLDREPLFMHGGTPHHKRQELIDRFQAADGRHPVFVLSLKAGGVGLNLTAANHVFHFDRWWNPAVENQATDRAYRIGQTRTVHVHKFVCVGTLEERIDEMLEHKSELAENIIGAGEAWLTELSTGQLRDLLALRYTATEIDA